MHPTVLCQVVAPLVLTSERAEFERFMGDFEAVYSAVFRAGTVTVEVALRNIVQWELLDETISLLERDLKRYRTVSAPEGLERLLEHLKSLKESQES